MTKKAAQRKTRKPGGALPVAATRAYRIVIIKDGQFMQARRRQQSLQGSSAR